MISILGSSSGGRNADPPKVCLRGTGFIGSRLRFRESEPGADLGCDLLLTWFPVIDTSQKLSGSS